MVSMDFHWFCDFGARGAQKHFGRNACFSLFSYHFDMISIWFPLISIEFHGFGDFGARGAQKHFVRNACFSLFSWHFYWISIWFPWISMDLMSSGRAAPKSILAQLLFFMVFISFSLFCHCFSWFFHGFRMVSHGFRMVFSKNWISKNWKSIDIHCWTP